MKQAAKHITFARHLRRSATDAERALWAKLRNRQLEGLKFRRQDPLGPYTVDFVCFERKLVIEVDGGQHAAAAEQDELRTRRLRERGYMVLRFWTTKS
jgi:very-short-patch-repair endonuclease